MSNDGLANKVLEAIPEGSIGRYDLSPVFKDAKLFAEIVEYLAAPYTGKVDFVASPEAIGWILGVAAARKLGIGFVPLRKGGKLPYPKEMIISQNYIDYSNKEKTLEIKKNTVTAGSRALIVDEWVETGISMHCCIGLLNKIGCTVAGLAAIGIDYREGTKDWIDSGFIRFIGRDM